MYYYCFTFESCIIAYMLYYKKHWKGVQHKEKRKQKMFKNKKLILAAHVCPIKLSFITYLNKFHT